MAWIPRDVLKIPLRLWSMLTDTIPADFSRALSCCESPVLQQPKDILLDSDDMMHY